MLIRHEIIEVATEAGIALHDITGQLRQQLAASGIRHGFAIVTSRHTTTALTINEHEQRLMADVKAFLQRLVPAQDRYLHNDIHLRDCPPEEPENAHAHLVAMLLGSTEVIPVADGELCLGQWQSLLLMELDGPRRRTVNIQFCGE